jgi:hypothetical protein
VALVAIVLAAEPANAARCSIPQHGRKIASSSSVLVYRTVYSSTPQGANIVACWRATGRRTVITRRYVTADRWNPNRRLPYAIRIAGPLVGYWFSGAEGQRANDVRSQLQFVAFNVRLGRRAYCFDSSEADAPLPYSPPRPRVVLRSDGVVAWRSWDGDLWLRDSRGNRVVKHDVSGLDTLQLGRTRLVWRDHAGLHGRLIDPGSVTRTSCEPQI